MWLKLCLLLIYISLLFLLSRILDALSWCEFGYGGALSHQLQDPVLLSVARLKALLEQRGVSYEGVVEKSELTSLVDASGQISAEEVELSQIEGKASEETNFTSGAHFIEQVEDAKDSVWLVQVVSYHGHFHSLSESRWKTVRQKVSKFGVRTGVLDCSLDVRYCHQKGWQSPCLLLALPSQFEKKASVALYNYSGSVRETAVLRWLRDKLDEKVVRITNPTVFQQEWQNFSGSSLDPEIRAVLFTNSMSAPLFYSALSVKFPGRVKFGLVTHKSMEAHSMLWEPILKQENIMRLPVYVIYTSEKTYIYGLRLGELYSFASMERFFKFLYPCLNDLFIISFCVANVLSCLEFFISKCSIVKRLRKLIWCVFKYNIMLIMLWLPIIGIFQMPFLDHIPLVALKLERIFSTSYFGTTIRGDCSFFFSHPSYIVISFGLYLGLVMSLSNKYRQEETAEEEWFNFSQMGTLTHLRPNVFFEPMRISGYDLMGGLDVFGSHLSRPSLWLQPSISSEYIKHLPTWRYCPQPLAARAAENTKKIELAIAANGDLCEQKVTKTSPKSADCSDIQQSRVVVTSDCFQNEAQINCSYLNRPQQTHTLPTFVSTNTRAQLSSSSATFCQTSDIQVHSFDSQISKTDQTSSMSNLSSDTHDGHVPACSCSCQFQHPPQMSNLVCCNVCSPSLLENSTVSDSKMGASNSPSMSFSLHPEALCSSPTQSGDSLETARFSSQADGSGFPDGFLESHQCVICLDEYSPLTMLCGLPCGHVFHETCIISWLNREKHFCPMCRWPSYKCRQSLDQQL